MTKYDHYKKNGSTSSKRPIHPIWRGIGFMFIILIPFIAYFSATALLDAIRENNWMRIPAELIINWQVEPYILVKIIFAIPIMLILYVFLNAIGVIIMKALGPPQYGPTDAPPVRRGTKRYKR